MTEGLPPSAKFVRYVLEEDGPCTRQELIEKTELPEDSIDNAVSELSEREIATKTRESGDLRTVIVILTT
jgi:DNA-binding MarR family transcriptional regulator